MPLVRGTRYDVMAGWSGQVATAAPLGLGIGISPVLMPTPQPVEEPQDPQVERQPAGGGGPGNEEEPAASVGGAPERQQ
jgi:hypothetical protein